jgi:UDP-galactopyranose mutase
MGLDPSELDASVTARVPTRTNRDDRYFADTFQAMPQHGYTRMFEKHAAHPNIKVMLNTDYRESRRLLPWEHMVYTGPIDAFFNYARQAAVPQPRVRARQPGAGAVPAGRHGQLSERLRLHRITEFKHLTGQRHPRPSIVYEYPRADGDPYYPVPRPENAALYKRYEAEAEQLTDVTFVGRLATYKYYNMDQVVGQALAAFVKAPADSALGPGSPIEVPLNATRRRLRNQPGFARVVGADARRRRA